jgi:crotonobetainyl-CoA:carnitine CoA-transferase CaiB-like acyl-CoA transferase
MAALLAREKTGKGQHVDISYTDGALSLITMFTALHYQSGAPMKRGETVLQCGYPYYGVYKCKDGGYLSLGTMEPWFWQNLCRAIGKEEFISDCFTPDHLFNKPQSDKWEKIRASVGEIFLTKTRDEWFDMLTKHDVPVGKVYDIDEFSDDPQIKHRQMVVEIDDPKVGKVRQTGIAIKLSDTPGKIRSLAPLFGEHTDEVLLGLGYSKKQIDELRQAQAIG